MTWPADLAVLAELRRLLAEATPGPWHVTDCRHQRGGQLRVFAPLSQVANVLANGERPDADAALIVALRNHADALLDVVEEARRVIDVDHGVCHPDLLRALARLDGKETQ